MLFIITYLITKDRDENKQLHTSLLGWALSFFDQRMSWAEQIVGLSSWQVPFHPPSSDAHRLVWTAIWILFPASRSKCKPGGVVGRLRPNCVVPARYVGVRGGSYADIYLNTWISPVSFFRIPLEDFTSHWWVPWTTNYSIPYITTKFFYHVLMEVLSAILAPLSWNDQATN